METNAIQTDQNNYDYDLDFEESSSKNSQKSLKEIKEKEPIIKNNLEKQNSPCNMPNYDNEISDKKLNDSENVLTNSNPDFPNSREEQYQKTENLISEIHPESQKISRKPMSMDSKVYYNEISSPDKEIENFNGLINLNNFDPFNPKKLINSPRSLEICLSNGVDLQSLYHKSYENIKSIFIFSLYFIGLSHPLKRNNDEYLRLRYIETENFRKDLVDKLRYLRSLLIEENQTYKTEINTRATTTKFSNGFTRIDKLATCAINLLKPNFASIGNTNLGKDLIKQEQKKAVAVTAKELRALVQNLKGKMPRFLEKKRNSQNTERSKISIESPRSKNNTTYSGNNEKSQQRSKNKTEIIREHREAMEMQMKNKSMEIYQRIKQNEEIAMKWRNKQIKIKKHKKIFSELEQEKNMERKKLAERREEYKRQKLQEKIIEENQRSEEYFRKKDGLKKLRQEIRKNANYSKYQAKQQLEKIVRKANASPTAEAREKLELKMFEVAGLGKVWQMANLNPQTDLNLSENIGMHNRTYTTGNYSNKYKEIGGIEQKIYL